MAMLHDKLGDLWTLIDSQHLLCLNTEATTESEPYRRLENSVRTYLYLAPHERKFRYHQTGDVLRRTIIMSEASFDPVGTSKALNAVAKYAENLLVQPWREEFKMIKLYCGYYKHVIEKYLVDAVKLFQTMGYSLSSQYPTTLILQGVMDPDSIVGVSRDAIVAQVEIQIIQKIYEKLSLDDTVTWSDILSFRENHAGSPEQAVKTLMCRMKQRAYHESQCRQLSYVYPSNSYVPNSYYNPICTNNYAYPSAPYELQPHDFYPSNGYHHVQHNYNGYPQPQMADHLSMSAPSHGFQQSGVPTARLIELESPPHNISRGNYLSRERDAPLSKARDDGAGSWEHWDLVYKNFENQGYRKEGFKDRHYMEGHCYPRELEENPVKTRKTINVMDSPKLREVESDIRFELNDKVKDRKRVVKNVEKQDLKPREDFFLLEDSLKKLQVSRENSNLDKKEPEPKRQPIEPKETNLAAEGPCTVLLPPERGSWSCVNCTYINGPSVKICDMCAKSKSQDNNLNEPFEGIHCTKCTLLNNPGANDCSACREPLIFK